MRRVPRMLALWMGRRHLLETIKKAWSGKESDEPIHERYAWLGLIGGFVFMVFFCHLAGMNVLVCGMTGLSSPGNWYGSGPSTSKSLPSGSLT